MLKCSVQWLSVHSVLCKHHHWFQNAFNTQPGSLQSCHGLLFLFVQSQPSVRAWSIFSSFLSMCQPWANNLPGNMGEFFKGLISWSISFSSLSSQLPFLAPAAVANTFTSKCFQPIPPVYSPHHSQVLSTGGIWLHKKQALWEVPGSSKQLQFGLSPSNTVNP